MRDRRRVAMRVAAVGLGLAGLAVTVPTFAAPGGGPPVKPAPRAEKPAPPVAKAPAPEKCCATELAGPASTVTAGGAPAEFELVVSRPGRGCTPARRTIEVRLDDLATRHVRLERLVSGQAVTLRDTSTATGTVQAVDPLVDSKLICGPDLTVAASYRISFLDGAPLGRAELVVATQTLDGKVLDSAEATTMVVEAMGTSAPPPESTPPAPATDQPATEEPAAPPVADPDLPDTSEAPAAVARPPLSPASETSVLSTTLLTASIVFALSAMLLVLVLWRLRRAQPTPAYEVPTVTLPPGVGAELAMLQESSGAADQTRPTAP